MRRLVPLLLCAVVASACFDARLDIGAFEAAWQTSLSAAFPEAWPKLEALAGDGLLTITDDALTVTGKGRFLIRNVAMAFDRYLPPETAGFSRAI